MKYRLNIIFMLAFFIWGAVLVRPVPAASQDVLFQRAQEAWNSLEKDLKSQKLRQSWFKVIDRFKAVGAQDPGSALAQKSLAALGDLYARLYRVSRRADDLDESIGHYRKLVKMFPQGEKAPYAQLRVGLLLFYNKKDPDRAYVELLKVELNHPRSAEVAEARRVMAKISNTDVPPDEAPAQPLGEPGKKTAETAGESTPDPVPTPRPTAEKKSKPAPSGNGKALVAGLRHWSNPNYSRVAIDLDREVVFKDHLLRQDPTLGKPMRLYLDLEQTRVGPDIPEELPIADGLLKRARVAQFDQDTARVVLDIQNIGNYKIFSMNDPFRILVDVTADAKAPLPPQVAAPEPKKSPKPEPLDLMENVKKRKKSPRGPAQTVSDGQASLARQLGLGVSRVVIDPGHGGKDCGAQGVTGLNEKDLTFKTAQRLAEKVRKRLKLEVFLTRTTDVFMTLEERTAFANTKGADLFLSIHANAHPSAAVHGLETYFLNLTTDREAMRVAAMENATTNKKMSDLQMILGDLMLNSKIKESGSLGTMIHKAMVAKLKLNYKDIHDLGVKQAPFYVLIGANMPSILVELGFMSNKAEEARLKNELYLDRLMDGIVDGIRNYNASIKSGG
ncbi:MAG: N-acetylmuramoyl-L-alanine amidase [Pseudomonadota bacterium]